MARYMHDREDGEFIGRHGRDRFLENRRDVTGQRGRKTDRQQPVATSPSTAMVSKVSNGQRKGVDSDTARKDTSIGAAVKKIQALANELYEGRIVYRVTDGEFKGKYCYFTRENEFRFINRDD